LAPREAVVWRLPLSGEPDLTPGVQRRQYFGDAGSVLAHVRPGAPVATTIKIPAGTLTGARRAWLQVTVEHLAASEGTVQLNGRSLALPPAVTLHNNPRILRVPVAVADLQATNALEFRCVDSHAGWRLASASLVVER
jgi:hypothetical protein